LFQFGLAQLGGDQGRDSTGPADGFDVGFAQLKDFSAGLGFRVPSCDPDDGWVCFGHDLPLYEKTSSGINNDQKIVGLSPDEVLGWEISQRDIPEDKV
jgi:hypothetical protein